MFLKKTLLAIKKYVYKKTSLEGFWLPKITIKLKTTLNKKKTILLVRKHTQSHHRHKRNKELKFNIEQNILPSETKTFIQQSILPRTIRQWNNLPAALTAAPSLETFKRGVAAN